jgi:aryl-alcohol dehydrogenase-like predicted oxidoreductase
MKYRKLGRSNIEVSKLCMGTMTFGEQNTQEEAFEQLDYAKEQGVNFIDTAEMYSVPGRPETMGSTETIIGNWLQSRGNRDNMIVATKAVGAGVKYIRNGPNFSAGQLQEALDGSLKRLQTDYIDVYQLHWPERENNRFGTRLYPYHKNEGYENRFLESVETLMRFKKEGKIRSWGLSNETPWGAMKYLQICKEHNFEAPVTTQNAYGLLNRQFEYGLSEIEQFEELGLLAYSPLSFGALTGKYLNNQEPEGARLTKFKIFNRFLNPRAMSATAAYKELAESIGLSVVELGLAFVNHQPFVHSTIIGATKMSQLKENIGAFSIELKAETLREIDKLFDQYPDPGL